MAANPNTPEGQIEQAGRFASWLSSGARISRGRLNVLWILGGLVIAVPLAAFLLSSLVDWLND